MPVCSGPDMDAAIKGSVPIFASLLARRCGVEVEWGDFPTASVDRNRRIRMPDLPLRGQGLAQLVYGFTIHEAGHIRHTDFDVVERRVVMRSPEHAAVLMNLWNCVEDPRIEVAQCREFFGARQYLVDLMEFLDREGKLGRYEPEAPLPQQLTRWVLWRVNVEVMQYGCLADRKARQERLMQRLLPASLYTAIAAALARAPSAASTADAMDIAEAILDALMGASQSPPSGGQPQGAGGQQGCAQVASCSQPQGQKLHGAGEQQGIAQVPSGGQPQGMTPGELTPEQTLQLLASDNWVQACDRGAIVSALLPQAVHEASLRDGGNGHGASTVHMPNVHVCRDRVDGSSVLADVRRGSIALRSAWEDALQDCVLRRVSAARSGRKLVRDAGARVARGNGKVFCRRSEREAIAASIRFLLDKSGSMRKSVTADKSVRRIDRAVSAVLLMAAALEDLDGVETAIDAFPHEVGSDKNGILQIKGEDETVRECAGRVGSVQAWGDTPMASAILHAQTQLACVSEGRRIVLLVTDGLPDSIAQCMAVMEAGLAGVEYAAIGIGVDVSHLFAVSITIETVDELPAKGLELVKQLLLERQE